MPRNRAALAASAALALCLVVPAPAPAATTGEGCPRGEICLWSEPEFTGLFWSWRENGGYANVPAYMHDHVGSYASGGTFCLINNDPLERVTVGPDTFNADFDDAFGSRIDGLQGGAC